jgi:hypothetical protein
MEWVSNSKFLSLMFAAHKMLFTSGFNPLSLSPALWLDAADSATLFDATSGGSLPAINGLVARWEDKSGNDRHFTQSSSGAQPTRILGGVQFDGASDRMTLASNVITDTQLSVFVVIAKLSVASGYVTPIRLSRFQLLARTPTSDEWGVWQAAEVLSGDTLGSTNSLLTILQDTPTAITLATNGVGSIQTNGVNFPQDASPNSIGASSDGSQLFDGSISEVLVFPHILTVSERLAVESYLMKKWSI